MPGDELSIAKHRYEVVYTSQAEGPPPELDEDPFARGLLEKAGLERPRHRDSERPPKDERPAVEENPADQNAKGFGFSDETEQN